MSLTKNVTHQCKRCVGRIPFRQLNSGSSNVIEPVKMQEKTLVLSQWKLLNQLKNYMAKFSNDKTFENALNKEFAHFLQKIKPSVYGSELVRYFESMNVAIQHKNEATVEESKEEKGISIPGMLNGFKFGKGKAEEAKKVVPKWKEAKVTVSKEAVICRTQHILTMLANARTNHSKLTLIEDLNAHIKNHAAAKHNAVKEGAIRLVLKLTKSTNNEIKELAYETLALLGYAKPVAGSGVRILSIDGGGVRGILVIEMLKKLEELSGKSVHEMFDLICGVSTGAIIASLIGLQQKSLEEISEIYKNLSTQIFTQSPLKGTSNLVWAHSYYDTALWERLLKERIGDKTLISTSRDPKTPKLCALSAIVSESRLSAYVFRNYSLSCRVQSQYRGSHEHLIWEAVRASAAAPTYFEEFKLGNKLHQDGGILNNNPTAVAIHEAKLLWPDTPLQCIVSFGTGRTVPNPINEAVEPLTVNSSSWKKKFFAIIDSATDTEGVNSMLSDLLPGSIYYRFNPYLTEMLDIAEIDQKKLEQLKRDAVMYLRRNEDKFHDAANALNMKKGFVRKAVEFVNHQSEIHGLKERY